MTNYEHSGTDVPETTSGMQVWDSLEAFAESDDFEQVLTEQFPREAAILKRSGMKRRTFLQLMGASLIAGGLSLSGCAPSRRPHEEILPYARMPEELVPGVPLNFASTMVLGGYGTGVLIETHEGRPHRVEGNPLHPASLGGSNSLLLASILELYNPQRSTQVRNDGSVSTISAFLSALESALADVGTGAGLRILTEMTSSPSFAAQMDALLQQYPDARWYQYEPVGRDNVIAGAELAFGEAVNTYYRFDEADVVLALDADFLMSMPGNVRYTRDFAARRKQGSMTDTTMSRLYAVESTPSNTGAMADHRLALRSSDVGTFVMALADSLGVAGGAPANDPAYAAWLDAVANDLQSAASTSLVVVGDEQPTAVHALVHAINAALGNVGTTVIYTDPVLVGAGDLNGQLAELVGEMSAGNVEMLFVLGGNPAYNAPVDIPFSGAMERVPFSVHTSLYFDETSELATWHVPGAHYVEAWGDARAIDGTASIIQPPIGALYNSVRSDIEMMALVAGDTRSGYEIVREYWQGELSGDFEPAWRRALHDGLLVDTAFDPITPSVGSLSDLEMPAADGIELLFRVDPSMGDGRFAFNGWLHEVPHPLTKIAWDTVAMMSAATAEQLDLTSGNLIDVTANGRTMQVPAWVVPGHADNAISVALGYGRGIGADVEAGLSFNAYAIRSSSTPWLVSDVTVVDTGTAYALARTQQESYPMDTYPVREATLDEFLANGDGAFPPKHEVKDATFLSEFDYDGYAWGMTIDLTTCVGCNACMVACQSENNIPTVGKAEVLQHREMHWIRVDRWYGEDDNAEETRFQPVPCMHCENAPCEQVCPVQATVHDHEGLNQMIYNRCVGTRYCSANCPYGVRRFNFKDYIDETPILEEQRNPDVSVRMRGVMEKCTYCVQRINQARVTASKENRPIRDGEVTPACASACPAQAITFGDVNDPNARVSVAKATPFNYGVLEELNTVPRTTYLGKLVNPNSDLNVTGSEE